MARPLEHGDAVLVQSIWRWLRWLARFNPIRRR